MCSLQEHIQREIRAKAEEAKAKEAQQRDNDNWFAEHAEGYR